MSEFQEAKPTVENEPSAAKPARKSPLLEAIDNPWVVLILLFFVMAILGLPVLWKSRGFSLPAKLGLSIVVTLYTGLLFWLVWLVFVWCWSVVSKELGWS